MRNLGWLLLVTSWAAACQPAPRSMTDADREAVAREVKAQADSIVATLNQLQAHPYVDQLAINDAYAENGAYYPSRDSLISAVGHFAGMFKGLELAWDGEPHINVLGPDAAVISSAFHETAQPVTGAAMNLHGIWTGVYQRVNGRWGIVQAHESWMPDQASAKK